MKTIFNLPTYEWDYFKLLAEYEVAMANVSAAGLNVEAFHKKRGKLAEGNADMGLGVWRSTVWDLMKVGELEALNCIRRGTKETLFGEMR